MNEQLIDVGGASMRIPEMQIAKYAFLTNEQLLEAALEQKFEHGMTTMYCDHYLKQRGIYDEYLMLYRQRKYEMEKSEIPINLRPEKIKKHKLVEIIENGDLSYQVIYLDDEPAENPVNPDEKPSDIDEVKPHSAEFNFEKLSTSERIKSASGLSFAGVILAFFSGWFFKQFELTWQAAGIALACFVGASAVLFAISTFSQKRFEGDDDE